MKMKKYNIDLFLKYVIYKFNNNNEKLKELLKDLFRYKRYECSKKIVNCGEQIMD